MTAIVMLDANSSCKHYIGFPANQKKKKKKKHFRYPYFIHGKQNKDAVSYWPEDNLYTVCEVTFSLNQA